MRFKPHKTNQPAAAAFYPHLTHTVRLHLGNASLSGIETRNYTRIIPCQRGFSADAHPHHPTTREQSGLVGNGVGAWSVDVAYAGARACIGSCRGRGNGRWRGVGQLGEE